MVAGVLYWALALLLIAGLLVVGCFVAMLTWLGRRREAKHGSPVTVTTLTLKSRAIEAAAVPEAASDHKAAHQ